MARWPCSAGQSSRLPSAHRRRYHFFAVPHWSYQVPDSTGVGQGFFQQTYRAFDGDAFKAVQMPHGVGLSFVEIPAPDGASPPLFIGPVVNVNRLSFLWRNPQIRVKITELLKQGI